MNLLSNEYILCQKYILYYPPFNFKRTGCRGCPYALELQKQLEIMQNLVKLFGSLFMMNIKQ